MKRLLNTLYVTTQGSYLARQGETVLVRVEQETRPALFCWVCAGSEGSWSPFSASGGASWQGFKAR